MKLVSVEQMRAIEKASDAAGHTYAAMMERAGSAVAEAVLDRLGDVKGARVVVLVGPGNNGGDGLVAARVLRQAGAEVACYLFKARDETDPNFAAARQAGCFVAIAADDAEWHVLRKLVREAAVVVDALLGTGTARPIQGDLAGLLGTVGAEIHARRHTVPSLLSLTAPPLAPDRPLLVGVDGPSGMDYDSGALDPLALSLDVTVTFAYPKLGHFRFPAADACGELIVADIGTPPGLAQAVELELADAGLLRALLPARPRHAHKGTFGKVLVVAGSVYYSGASALAAQAAYRVGSGLVTLALPGSIYPAVACHMMETTYLILPDDMGVLTPDAARLLMEKASAYQAMLVGPGLSAEKESVACVQRLFGAELPGRKRMGFQAALADAGQAGEPAWPRLVVDADGLNALAHVDGWWQRLPAQTILTPHPGEMARLMKVDGGLPADRWELARHMAGEWGHVLVLKGAFTVVASPDGRMLIVPFANPALATAGSGDVLAGAIAGLLGQGLAPFEAAVAGAYLHGLAGELARRDIGQAGALAGDVLARLPRALGWLRAT